MFTDQTKRDTFFLVLWHASAERLKNIPGITGVTRQIATDIDQANNGKGVFPHTNKWNSDNYGPIYVPEKENRCFNSWNLAVYKMIITDYETAENGVKNELQVNGTK
jgi:signal peptidase I